jgi:hypothetical protein
MTLEPASLALHLRAVGLIMAGLVAVNVCVPGRLGWKEDLARVSPLNRQIFVAHTVFLILLLALLAALFLACADALLEPGRLSRAVLSGLIAFWGLRMLMQWFFYSPAHWRGDRFRTLAHGVFSLAWIYVTGVCASALWVNLHAAAR